MPLPHPQAIPLPRQPGLLELVSRRLRDKSSNVRKSAIQLFTAFLSGNPFASRVGGWRGAQLLPLVCVCLRFSGLPCLS